MILQTGRSKDTSVIVRYVSPGSNVPGSAAKRDDEAISKRKSSLYFTCNDVWGFSMIELMATVIIVAICLVLVFRVFSTCARALSEASYSMAALSVMEDKMAELQLRVVEDDGLRPSSSSDNLTVDNRKIQFNENIVEWMSEEEEAEEIQLCEVELKVSWQARGRDRKLILNTFMPAEGYADEF